MRPIETALRSIGALWSLRVSRFAVIGVASTLAYAAIAFLLSVGLGQPILTATQASVTAYALAAVLSYTGHKYVTFLSDGKHAFEAPRFLALTVLGLGLSWLLPLVLVDGLGLRAFVPILATCIVVPVVNYVVLGRWVFAFRHGQCRI